MTNRKWILSIIILAVCSTSYLQKNTEAKSIKIKLIFQERTLTATMNDTPTARDFLSLLPLELTLDDYAATEKVSQLPRRLSTKNTPAGSNPSVGDITYYSPWGNLAIFYRDFGYAGGLIILGRIDSGAGFLENWKGSKTVRIELMDIKQN